MSNYNRNVPRGGYGDDADDIVAMFDYVRHIELTQPATAPTYDPHAVRAAERMIDAVLRGDM